LPYSNMIKEYQLTVIAENDKSTLMKQMLSYLLLKKKGANRRESILRTHSNDHLLPRVKNSAHADLFGQFQPPAESEKPYKMELIIGDLDGNLKWLDLSIFVDQSEGFNNTCSVSIAEPYAKIKPGFMANRRIFNTAAEKAEYLKQQ